MLNRSRGYSLIELMVAISLFSIVVTIATGAYLLMISANREAQAITTGINNLSYALESMTRTIRTGAHYSCSGDTFSFYQLGDSNKPLSYKIDSVSKQLQQSTNGTDWVGLTDPSVSIDAANSKFICVGTAAGASDTEGQARVTIVVAGTVNAGAGKDRTFNIETSATMRGTDL